MIDADTSAIIAEAEAFAGDNAIAAVTDEGEAAVDETAAPEEEPAAAIEEAEESAEVEDAPAEDDAEPEDSDSVDFDDLLNDIPSNESLLREHNRIPQATKDALTGLADKARSFNEVLEPLGGTEGVKSFIPIAQMLDKAEPTSEDFTAAIGSMFQRNGPAVVGMVAEAAENLLFNTEKTPDARAVAKFGDAILQNRFGLDSAKIEKFALLEKGGFNIDEELEIWNDEGARSSQVESLQSSLEQLKAEKAELQRLVDNPELVNKPAANAVKELDEELARRLEEGINPFRERVQWEKDSALTRLTMKALTAELKDSPEYREAVKFVGQYGTLKSGDVIPHAVERLLYLLTQKGKGRFGTEAVEINKQFRTRTGNSLNAKREKEVKEATKPKAAPVVGNGSSRLRTMFGDDIGSELDKIYNEARQAA